MNVSASTYWPSQTSYPSSPDRRAPGPDAAAVPHPPPPAAEAKDLTPQEERRVEELKRRDAEVVRHEEAHFRAAGPYAASSPQYEYEEGPDGQRYRVGGHVSIDTRPLPDPEATIRKAEVVKQAALAPHEPSSQDRKIAAEADQMKRNAERLMAAQERQETKEAARQAATDATTEAARPADSSLAQPPDDRPANPYEHPLPFTRPIYVNTIV